MSAYDQAELRALVTSLEGSPSREAFDAIDTRRLADALLRYGEAAAVVARGATLGSEVVPVLDALAGHLAVRSTFAHALGAFALLATKGLAHPALVPALLRGAGEKTRRDREAMFRGLYFAALHGKNDLRAAHRVLDEEIAANGPSAREAIQARVTDAVNRGELEQVQRLLEREASAPSALLSLYSLARYKGVDLPALRPALTARLSAPQAADSFLVADVVDQLAHIGDATPLLAPLARYAEAGDERALHAAVRAMRKAAERGAELEACLDVLVRACGATYHDRVAKQATARFAAEALGMGLRHPAGGARAEAALAKLEASTSRRTRDLAIYARAFGAARGGDGAALRAMWGEGGSGARATCLEACVAAWTVNPSYYFPPPGRERAAKVARYREVLPATLPVVAEALSDDRSALRAAAEKALGSLLGERDPEVSGALAEAIDAAPAEAIVALRSRVGARA